MRLYFISLCLCLCLLGGCISHSTGQKSVNFITGDTSLEQGKSIYVTVTPPVIGELADNPAFIAAQFSKYLTLVSRESLSGDLSEKNVALAEAKQQKNDYLILLTVNIWTCHSLFSKLGQEASLNIETIDVKTEKTLNISKVDARCYVMLAGLEQSPRECIRPQIDLWMQKTFNTMAKTPAQTDEKTFIDFNSTVKI